ncbi:MAG: iron-sulfur cluster assembly scaffold protein [Pyrinomonadaceae bacterium]
MAVYPELIGERFRAPGYGTSAPEGSNATGISASFTCASFVTYRLWIDGETKEIRSARFSSNGCGFMIAAADVIAEMIEGRKLTNMPDLETELEKVLGKFGDDRTHCLETCLDAVRSAFEDHRTNVIEEFVGEKALICTCFGVSQETIEICISKHRLTTIDEVSDVCKAGSGCKACQMLIQEILDHREYPTSIVL